jgi:signal transduction histidine kinase
MLVLLVLEVPLAVFFAQRERERIAANLERDASVIATVYEDDLERGRPLDRRPAERYEQRTGARVVVVDRAGISLVDTAATTDRDLSTRPEIAAALSGRRATGTRSSDTLATDLLYVAVPVASGGTVHGALRLTIDTGDATARIHRFWWGLGAIAVVVLGLVALVGWALASSVTRPIRRLQADADRFAGGDLTVHDATSTGPPELRSLAASIATMAEQLHRLLASQRAFVADASHQLRSPLTALRLRLENLQSTPADRTCRELDAAIEETDRLRTLVNDLLQLARIDERPPVAEFDLTRLTMERIDTWTAVAESRQVQLRAGSLDRPLTVRSVAGAIEQILDNLLDNALAVAPAGSAVTVTITAGAKYHQLGVCDQGPGLDDEHKALATRRFWRGATTTQGSGLGLAIVETLATASDGQLELTDAPNGGLCAIVSLPASRHRAAGGPATHPSAPG